MRYRIFIIGLMFLAYGTILGHELIYGHHTGSTVTYHKHHSDCCDDHGQNSEKIPCSFDLKPHFISQVQIIEKWTENKDLFKDCWMVSESPGRTIMPEHGFEVPPDYIVPGLFSVSLNRSLGLRGPPSLV